MGDRPKTHPTKLGKITEGGKDSTGGKPKSTGDKFEKAKREALSKKRGSIQGRLGSRPDSDDTPHPPPTYSRRRSAVKTIGLSDATVDSGSTPTSGDQSGKVGEPGSAQHKTTPIRKRITKIHRISPKVRFKQIVRKVIRKGLHKDTSGQGGFAKDKKAGQLFFDKTQFKASNKSRGLTSIERRILEKEPADRTDEDLMILRGVVDRLKCFDKYTPIVKRDLSRVIFYMTLNAGRCIIKQGHDGFSFYFIVSGKVQVRIKEIDRQTGVENDFAVAEMPEGSSFGELALMHNIKRTATIMCIANNSEFLRVDRHDFESVLRISTMKEWNERLEVLKWQPYFSDFELKELEELNNHCKIVEYPPGKLIIGDTKKEQDTMIFVSSGICTIIRELTIVREKLECGKEKLHLLENLSESDKMMFPRSDIAYRRGAASRFLKPETQLWTVGYVGKGFFFGVGEDLTNTFVLAKNKVEMLEVRRIKFVKNGRWKLPEKMRDEFDRALPTSQDLFDKYMEESIWDHYKQKLVTDIVRKRSYENNTRWEDVPLSLRRNSLRAGSLQKNLYVKI